MYISYTNGLIDVRDGRPVFYLPVYAGLEDLNQEATKIWQSLGFEVRPVDVSATFQQGGTLHCLVNPLLRSI